MKIEQEIFIKSPKAVLVSFPFMRSKLEGEYNFGGFRKTYWKFYNPNKVTVITEEMCQTTILTYNDPSINFFSDMVSIQMVECSSGFEELPHNIWDLAVDRLIQKVSNGI